MRVQRRLGAFVAASLVLHVFTFGSYTPGPGGHQGSEAAKQPALQAVLVHERVPEQPVGAARDTPAAKQQDVISPAKAPAHATSPGSGAHGTIQMPAPERWYEAAELDRRAEPLSPVEPAYPPEIAGLSAVTATVRLRLFIDERGAVRKLEIAIPGPRPEFDEAAKRAWEGVRFSPAMKDGVTVKSQKLLELAFSP